MPALRPTRAALLLGLATLTALASCTAAPAETAPPSASAAPVPAPASATASPSVAATAPATTSPASTAPATTAPPATKAPQATKAPPATTAPQASPAQLTLGGKAPRSASTGFGQVRPKAIDFGNHPTTVLRDVTWQSWGGAEARGTAEAIWVGPNQSTAGGTFEPAEVRAYAVGKCGTQPAYTRLQWTFPGKDPAAEQPAAFDLCTGDAVG